MANKQSKRAKREAARQAALRQRRIRWASLAIALVAVAGVFAALSGGSDNDAAALAPDFELETNNGNNVKLSDYQGQPVAVTFMHTY
jgi:cytochrome oxidase Cu insertion factor (SCO1/SenC/PrrC family)